MIADDEPTPAVSVADVSVRERDRFAELRVTRPAPTDLGTTRYAWKTRAGSALAGSDFKPSSGVVGFGTEDTSQTIRVPLLRDDVWEPAEAFTVVVSAAPLSSPWGPFPGPIDDGVATVTIAQDPNDLGDDGVPVIGATRLRGVVRVRRIGRLRHGVDRSQRGDVVDARRGAVRLWMPGVGPSTRHRRRREDPLVLPARARRPALRARRDLRRPGRPAGPRPRRDRASPRPPPPLAHRPGLRHHPRVASSPAGSGRAPASCAPGTPRRF